jgi:hypothetical protein
VISVRGRGLGVVTGCGHAEVVNIIRHHALHRLARAAHPDGDTAGYGGAGQRVGNTYTLSAA